jgi:hypothetical protein
MSDNSGNIFNEQGNVRGQRKDVNVKDYPSAIELANLLKNVNYPADKQTILSSIGKENLDRNILNLLEKIEDKQYSNSSEVVNATGIVSH